MRWLALLGLLLPAATWAGPTFSYTPPGELWPLSGSTSPGKGRADFKVYAPAMRFPVESAPAYPNSQVWGVGGSNGPAGSQCDARNFSYPWHDNYCESRSWKMPLCPSGAGHQGQDIRGASCQNRTHWVVAVADGTITSVGGYEVSLTAADGTRFRYLHMRDVAVSAGQKVKVGDRVGKISDNFNGTPTTVHLHFDVEQNVSGYGRVWVPGYLSLVRSYERLLGIAPPADGGVAPVDAGLPRKDAGTPIADAGVPDPLDAGQPEPTPKDAGTQLPPAGGGPSGGLDGLADGADEQTSGGCQVAAAPLSSSLGLLALAALARRRRRPGGRR